MTPNYYSPPPLILIRILVSWPSKTQGGLLPLHKSPVEQFKCLEEQLHQWDLEGSKRPTPLHTCTMYTSLCLSPLSSLSPCVQTHITTSSRHVHTSFLPSTSHSPASSLPRSVTYHPPTCRYISLARPNKPGMLGVLPTPPFCLSQLTTTTPTPSMPSPLPYPTSLGKGYWKVVQFFVFVCVQKGEDVHPAASRHTSPPCSPPSALIGQSPARTQTHTKAAHAFLSRAPAGDTERAAGHCPFSSLLDMYNQAAWYIPSLPATAPVHPSFDPGHPLLKHS